MAKVIDLTNQSDEFAGHMIMCPGCGCGHLFDKRWTFNGDYEKPTFSPSMLCNANMPIDPPRTHRCHSFVTDGKIQFLSDCTHELAGQTVELGDV
jgi:hypothetical protein